MLSTDGTKITFYSTSVTANQNGSTAVYEITLNQTANTGAGSYTFTVLRAPPVSQTSFDFSDLPSGQNLFGIIASNKADLTKGGLLVFPTNPDLAADGTMTNLSGTINTSKGGGPVTIGNGNQAFDHDYEGAWFVYVGNPAQSAVGGLGLSQRARDDADTIDFTGTIGVNNASVEIVQASGAGTTKRPGPVMHITAYDIDPGDVSGTGGEAVVNDPTALGGGAAEVGITGVKIFWTPMATSLSIGPTMARQPASCMTAATLALPSPARTTRLSISCSLSMIRMARVPQMTSAASQSAT